MIPLLAAAALKPSLKKASSLKKSPTTHLSALIPEGRLSEVEGHGATSAIVRLAAEAQGQGEPVAWITGEVSSVHPPDLAAGGIDLHSLAFLRIKDDTKSKNRLRAAELVLRSGAFALVIIEAPVSTNGQRDLPARALSRLHAMARRHNTRVVFRRSHLSKVSLGPLIGLKVHVGRKDERLLFRTQKNKVGHSIDEVIGETVEESRPGESQWRLQMPDGFADERVSTGADVIPFSPERVSEPSLNPSQGDLFEAFRLSS